MTPAEVFFGGTFDPPHTGHLFVAQEVSRLRGGATVLFVPAPQNPLKSDAPKADDRHRLAMVQLAIAGVEAFSVSRFELDHAAGAAGGATGAAGADSLAAGGARVQTAKPSYTIETLEAMIREGALVDHPALVIGDDLVSQLPRWHRYTELLALVELIVVGREASGAMDGLPPGATLVANPQLRISSSEIRARVASGRPIRYLVPDVIERYIAYHGLYRAADAA